jgi:hypothetical protein
MSKNSFFPALKGFAGLARFLRGIVPHFLLMIFD